MLQTAWRETDSVTSSSTTQQYPLWSKREEDTSEGFKVYRYVLANEAVAAGDLCVALTPLGKVNCATTVPAITALKTVGVGVGTIAAASYGWIQTKGYCGTLDMSTSATLVAGNPLVHSGTATKAKQYTVTGTYVQAESQEAALIFGYAATATSANANGNAILCCE